ncbi:hypothetical protein [Comamonas sp. GB3 AK4-5]|uniref:hypothetical protein n=1 Tax=Comamonas sp. GB3 AK4-5 TaxID=3231487 RepID=UPI00351E44EF
MYKGMSRIFSKYWCAYGGFSALIKSPYLHLALILLVFTYKIWSNANWWDISISVLPNLLGFTLGGFAVFLAFGDDKFREMLIDNSDDDDDDEDSNSSGSSLYVELCSTFVHFIVIQIFAFFFALISKSLNFTYSWDASIIPIINFMTLFFWGLGFLIFLYSMTSILAATMHLFRTATWYEMHQRSNS